ncbi:hypothetical protein FLW53_23565 [Microbispora sp. SCL1-1]|uniref:hypothetical protein n=1 Tax=unclassified Microbispora TaxID=2614687 RepID=UPI001157D694|nr:MULTISPECIES: hypothetical protein [unclassified Microbispora]NJP27124.1 hypothetical protein [Microbispora sp. CL1-1]TQS11469.1 hypothetical protein FLW53_23565 [Microbispora sp. SCL1-1]
MTERLPEELPEDWTPRRWPDGTLETPTEAAAFIRMANVVRRLQARAAPVEEPPACAHWPA